MAIKILFITLLSVAVASASNCCRGYKILQFRRAGILPMYESSSPCGNMYNHQDDYYDSSLYSAEPMPKYDSSVGRYYPPYMEPKTITHKCVCSKSVASQRMVTSLPRYYKRGYCSDPLMDGSCSQYSCGQYGDCGQYGQCGQCGQYGQCGQCAQYGQCPPCNPSCAMPPLFRQSSHRVLPLTLPASCVC